MSHLSEQKPKLLARVRRLKGQMEAIERALIADADCGEVLNQVASVRGAIDGLTAELIEDHIHAHLLGATTGTARSKAADELISVVRKYLK